MNFTIPKVIMQTGYSQTYDSFTKQKILKMNPSYKYEYYNNNDCIEFLQNNFPQDVTNAFNKLKPGAFKADLFRYCYLYINGGVYLDLDLMPKKPLDKIIVKDADFISSLENKPNRHINGVYQAFIACKKGINFLKIAIDRIVHYTKINYYPKKLESDKWISILSITGPVLLYNSINFIKRPLCGYTKINNITIYLYSFSGHIFDLNKKKIIENGIKYSKGISYSKLFLKKEIYK